MSDTVQTDVLWTLMRVWRREEREEVIKLKNRERPRMGYIKWS